MSSHLHLNTKKDLEALLDKKLKDSRHRSTLPRIINMIKLKLQNSSDN